MAVTNEFERDLINQAHLKRPGRIDLIVFQNVADAGDGSPGIQRAFRNYLHEGGMEKDLELIGFGIKGTSFDINNAELQQLGNIGASVITSGIWTQLSNIGASVISSNEWSQIANIGASVTIDVTQWGYLGALNQGLTATSNVNFGQITPSGNIVMTDNNITFTTGLVDGVDVSGFKSDYDTHKASTGADHTFIDQTVVIAGSPTFVGLTLSTDLITSSTVDGIDVSAIKLNSMPTVADGDIDANTQKIINVADPENDQDVATMKYARHGIASDDLMHSNDVEGNRSSGTWGKIKETKSYRSGKLRVYWEMRMGGGTDTVLSKIYINGVAETPEWEHGVVAWVAHPSGGEDIEVNYGDTIEIWGRRTGVATSCQIRYVRMKYNDFETVL